MTYRQDFTVPAKLMEQVAEQGLDILPELIRIVINAAMQTEICLREGHIVQLPNGTHFKPSGHKDGRIYVNVRVNPRMVRNINIGFRGQWRNVENIGKSEAEIIAMWNAAHPDDPIEVEREPASG